ncbi:MAG: hypothetical protein H0W21_02010 [Actinobacteria bacterium]|nr:hypothetical protein [Actinomycetota bacterium]
MPSHSPFGSFHVHEDHAFEGFTIETRCGAVVLIARCDCGDALDVADAVFKGCPDCNGSGEATASCDRCGTTGVVVDHSALTWRQT